MTVKSIAKALTAAVVAAAALVYKSLDGGVTPAEWVGIVSGTLAAGLAVWAVPNKD